MSSAKVQFMITNAMRAILVDDLDYLDAEVDVMRPEIAAQLIETRTKRPFGDRPMPEAWKRGGNMPQRRGGALSNNLVKLFLAGVCCLGAAVMSGRVSVGTLLGGAPLGRKPLKKLSSEMKSTKKRKRSSKKRRKKTAAA